jgi:hypothetical protein
MEMDRLDSENSDVRVKQLLGCSLTLRDYDSQAAEAMTMVSALNKMTKTDMVIPPKIRCVDK